MKTNSEIVKDYHDKLVEIKIRFPSEKQCGYDYPALIRQRAKDLGIINTKGKDKGEGSANAYILHLIEQDLGIEVKSVGELKNHNQDDKI